MPSILAGIKYHIDTTDFVSIAIIYTSNSKIFSKTYANYILILFKVSGFIITYSM